MASEKTRLAIVQLAVAQAGRGPELYDHAKELLNLRLRSWAFESKYNQLRKIGTQITLSAGQITATLPTDFGFGMENLLFGAEALPMEELELDEFIARGGFPHASATNGRPTFYTLDKNAGVIRFNTTADQDYPMTPIYYYAPDSISLQSSGDVQKVWFDDEYTLIQALIEDIYQFVSDDREMFQGQKTEAKKAEFKRGTKAMSGGTPTIRLSGSWFKGRRP
jgi:hypothetical protein